MEEEKAFYLKISSSDRIKLIEDCKSGHSEFVAGYLIGKMERKEYLKDTEENNNHL